MTRIDTQPVCPGKQPFARDQWYVLAFADEVKPGQTLARRCMDEPIVLYREGSGRVAALYDRCPHRSVPLSQGKVRGDHLECPYHGFQFNAAGKCVLIPTQPHIPSAACTRSFPVVERMGFVWVWMGDPARADEALVPGYEQMGCAEPGWQFANYFMMEIKANYSLLFENLLDTSHISYLHIGGIDGGLMATAPYTITTEGQVVTLDRMLARDVAVPGTAKLFSMPDGQVFSRRTTSRSFLPHLHLITNTIGFPDEPGRTARIRLNIMPITPVRQNHLYQFVVIATNYPVNVTDDLKKQLWDVFTQDREALEAIQAGYDELGPDTREVSVKADAAALTARRLLHRMGQAAAPTSVATGTAPALGA